MMFKRLPVSLALVCSLLVVLSVIANAIPVQLEGQAVIEAAAAQERVDLQNSGRKVLNKCDDGFFAAVGCFFGSADAAIDSAFDDYSDGYNAVSSAPPTFLPALVFASVISVSVLGMF